MLLQWFYPNKLQRRAGNVNNPASVIILYTVYSQQLVAYWRYSASMVPGCGTLFIIL